MSNVIRENIRLVITLILASVAAALGPSPWLTLVAVLAILITSATIEAWAPRPHRSGSDCLSARLASGLGTTVHGRDPRRVALLLITLLLVATLVGLSLLFVVHLYGEPSLLALVFALMLTCNALLLETFLALCRDSRRPMRVRDLRSASASRLRRGVSVMATAAITAVPCVLLVADPEVSLGLIGVWLVATGARHAISVWGPKTAGHQGAWG